MEREKISTEATYQFVYTGPMLRRAVRLFVWRAAMRRRGWLWLAAIALLGISLVWGWWSGEPSWMFGANLAAIAFVPLFFLILWRAHFINTVGRFRSMASPSAEVILRDQV
jgi:hypothetical protein